MSKQCINWLVRFGLAAGMKLRLNVYKYGLIENQITPVYQNLQCRQKL